MKQPLPKCIVVLSFALGLSALILSACASLSRPTPGQTGPGQPGSAAWALGEQPNFSGTLVDWAKGDAIAPGEGGIFATTYQTGDAEGIDLGFGSVKADGSFTLGLQRGATGLGLSPTEFLCTGLSLSNSTIKIVGIDVFEIPSHYVEGVHARPGGGVIITTQQVVLSQITERYTFMHAIGSGTVKGTCAVEGGTISLELDLRGGWNVVRYTLSGSRLEFKTAPLPTTVKWRFINPLTAGG